MGGVVPNFIQNAQVKNSNHVLYHILFIVNLGICDGHLRTRTGGCEHFPGPFKKVMSTTKDLFPVTDALRSLIHFEVDKQCFKFPGIPECFHWVRDTPTTPPLLCSQSGIVERIELCNLSHFMPNTYHHLKNSPPKTNFSLPETRSQTSPQTGVCCDTRTISDLQCIRSLIQETLEGDCWCLYTRDDEGCVDTVYFDARNGQDNDEVRRYLLADQEPLLNMLHKGLTVVMVWGAVDFMDVYVNYDPEDQIYTLTEVRY